MTSYRIIEKNSVKDNVENLEVTIILQNFELKTQLFLEEIKKELTDQLIPFQIQEVLKWHNPGFKIVLLTKDYKYLKDVLLKSVDAAEEQYEKYKIELKVNETPKEIEDEGEFEYFEQSKVIKGEEFSMFELPEGEGENE